MSRGNRRCAEEPGDVLRNVVVKELPVFFFSKDSVACGGRKGCAAWRVNAVESANIYPLQDYFILLLVEMPLTMMCFATKRNVFRV